MDTHPPTTTKVHRARLKVEHAINGELRDVAVKIRHPGVLEETFVDVDVISNAMNSLPFISTPFDKSTFFSSLQKQVNFEWEAHYLSRFASNFQKEMDDGTVDFPTVSPDLLSQSVLGEKIVFLFFFICLFVFFGACFVLLFFFVCFFWALPTTTSQLFFNALFLWVFLCFVSLFVCVFLFC